LVSSADHDVSNKHYRIIICNDLFTSSYMPSSKIHYSSSLNGSSRRIPNGCDICLHSAKVLPQQKLQIFPNSITIHNLWIIK